MAPGGNVAPNADEFLCEQSDKQFPIQPSTGTAVIVLGNVSNPGEALQPFKQQFDLPAHTVQLQNIRRRTAASSREHENVFSKLKRSRPGAHLLLARLALQASVGLLNRESAFSNCAQSAGKRAVLTMQDNSPFAVLASF